jgi:hypothetical protein
MRLRLAVRMPKADLARAKTEEEAVATFGLFTSNPGNDTLIFGTRKGDDYNSWLD